MQKELPPKAQERLRQIERWRDGHDGQRAEFHNRSEHERRRLQALTDERAKVDDASDAAEELDREIAAVRKRQSELSAEYTALGDKAMRLNQLRENLDAYLKAHGYLLLDQENPRSSRAPRIDHAKMYPQGKSPAAAARAERMAEHGWKE